MAVWCTSLFPQSSGSKRNTYSIESYGEDATKATLRFFKQNNDEKLGMLLYNHYKCVYDVGTFIEENRDD